MPSKICIEFGSQQLILLPDCALFWPEQNALVIADVHLGKDASFRAAGMPVPVGNSSKDLGRIEKLILLTAAKKLIILGDLVHNRASHQEELAVCFSHWRAAHASLEILLIKGNHDRHAGPTPADWNISQVPELYELGGLMLAHQPRKAAQPVLCGHVHPTVAVQDFDRSLVKMCCFVVDPEQLILPAFGSFTGGFKMQSEPGRRMYAVTGKSVVMLPSQELVSR